TGFFCSDDAALDEGDAALGFFLSLTYLPSLFSVHCSSLGVESALALPFSLFIICSCSACALVNRRATSIQSIFVGSMLLVMSSEASSRASVRGVAWPPG